MKKGTTRYIWVKNRLKGLSADISWAFGNHSKVKKATGARIFLYHGVCKAEPLRYNTLFVTIKKLEAQLQLYKKYFNIISLEDFYSRNFHPDRFNMCLSFDDGFANNLKYVLPLLEKYQLPASFFITGIREAGYDILWNDALSIAHKHGPPKILLMQEEFIRGKDGRYVSVKGSELLIDKLRKSGFDKKKEFLESFMSLKLNANSDYWIQMNVEEIRELSSSKWVTIGSHGYYHNDLAQISIADAKEELVKSKKNLENIIGKKVDALAFPYGSYSPEVVNEAKTCGFTKILATDFLFSSDAKDTTMRERLTINPFISNINQLHAGIRGKYKA